VEFESEVVESCLHVAITSKQPPNPPDQVSRETPSDDPAMVVLGQWIGGDCRCPDGATFKWSAVGVPAISAARRQVRVGAEFKGGVLQCCVHVAVTLKQPPNPLNDVSRETSNDDLAMVVLGQWIGGDCRCPDGATFKWSAVGAPVISAARRQVKVGAEFKGGVLQCCVHVAVKLKQPPNPLNDVSRETSSDDLAMVVLGQWIGGDCRCPDGATFKWSAVGVPVISAARRQARARDGIQRWGGAGRPSPRFIT